MKRRKSSLASALAALLFLASSASAFVTGPCVGTPQCKCKWSEGRRMADCAGAGFTQVPSTLTSDIQTLVLDNNPLLKLEKDIFKTAGLLNVQTLSLRRCGLRYVDENAFRDLKIMTHLDLSYNNVTRLDHKTFDGNDNLKTMRLSHNPLRELASYQFPPLRTLKTIDLSHCDLESVDETSFRNLGQSVESVLLNNNKLTFLRDNQFVKLTNLKALTLHTNPWVCDCKLKNFRDWVVGRKLYNRPTSCAEPSRLHGKTWDEVQPAEFACKPDIDAPYPRVFGAPGVDATLACRITGSPVPQARWVINGRIVNNNTHPAPLAEQVWQLRERRITRDGVERWYNLTISNPTQDDLGEYLCVAENNGGVMEKSVLFTFDDPATYHTRITDEQMTVVVGVTVAAVVLFLLILLVCCCCFCRGRCCGFCRSRKKKEPMNRAPENGYAGGGAVAVTNGDSQKLLPNGHHARPILKNSSSRDFLNQQTTTGYVPCDKYDLEMRTPSVISQAKHSSSASSSSERGGGANSISRTSFVTDMDPAAHFPDLLDHHHNRYSTLQVKPPAHSSSPSSASGSTVADPSRLHQLNPSHLLPGTQQPHPQYQHLMSPFQRSGTLPLPHPHHPRSVSCDHGTSQTPPPTATAYVALPVVHHHHHHPNQAQARPGYVTLPRRPRASWSVPRDTPSPASSLRADREPIYDGVGPRTSADGSSRLSLNKCIQSPPQLQQHPQLQQLHPQPQPRYALPPYYAPIEELQECPPTPKMQQARMQPNLPQSTPNMLDLDGSGVSAKPKPTATPRDSLVTSSSETTLLEENLSSYCEPFGKAMKPESPAPSSDSKNESSSSAKKDGRNSMASSSAESELETIVPPLKKGGKKSTKESPGPQASSTPRQNGQQDNQQRPGSASQTPLTNGQRNPHHHPQSVSPAGQNGGDPRHNNGAAAKRAPAAAAPPKTLPKPKVKPVPPPKPKKSFQEGNDSMTPLISFQDEGADGSEV